MPLQRGLERARLHVPQLCGVIHGTGRHEGAWIVHGVKKGYRGGHKTKPFVVSANWDGQVLRRRGHV